MTTGIGIGIDTARYGHHVSFLDEEKRTAAKPFHFKEDNDGYQQFRKALEKLRTKHPNATIFVRIDAAGQYADNLLHWLHEQKDLRLSISVGTPLANKRYCQVHYEKRKADPVESEACARFAVVERPTPMQAPIVAFNSLRKTVSALQSNSTHMTRLVNQLHLLLAISFPEFAVLMRDISKGFALKILEKYPTAKRLAAAKVESLLQVPHLREEVARTLYERSKASTAHADDLTSEALIKLKVKEIMDAKDHQADLLRILKKSWDALPDGPHRRILTIKGIGVQTAAALVAKIVNIERFKHDSSLIGYFGIFPEERDASGTHKDGTPKQGTINRMSAKGNDLVRRLLYTAAQTAVRFNPAIRALYARQAAMGKEYNVIIGHCMAKLLRQAHAVWVKDTDYDPEFETKHSKDKNAVGLKVDEPPVKEVTTTPASVGGLPSTRKPLNFAAVKKQVAITDVLRSYGWTASKSNGMQLRGPCPIHNADPTESSFAVHTGKNTFCCHRCGCKGNALDLLTAVSEQPLLDAVWTWLEKEGIEPTLLEAPKKRKTAEPVKA